ncbi:helitron_like_N domain-containing protein [Trichonephila clavipes]|nr:helitron_like_N domain-containing protein [Trichonephila clavipes]
MHEYAQDVIAYVRLYGGPDLFITFTCNPAWDEIQQLLLPGQMPVDRHDVTARVFRQKLKSLMDFMVKHEVFGSVRCWMYSVEWQKRGLPHAHTLIWLCNKITSNEIDDVICSEIPDVNIDKDLHEVVVKNMIHGPCGTFNPNSPCMIDGKCSKRYPRALISNTVTGTDGYPLYRRRSAEEGGKSATIRMQNRGIKVDNQWVVPYSPLLSKTYKAHINVENCNSVKSIKYICKYVNKGNDMAVFGMQQQETNDKNAVMHIDEVTQYQAGRYISSNEAVWRILSFPIHERSPAVVHLAVHLENGQRVYFTAKNVQQIVLNPPATTLTAFFTLCQNDAFAKTLLYSQVPTYYKWNASRKLYERRKRGEQVIGQPGIFKEKTIGTVHPNQDECFFLRMLLVNVPGPVSFQQLRTVNGVTHSTFRSACHALNLLENDLHWDVCINYACNMSHPKQIRACSQSY